MALNKAQTSVGIKIVLVILAIAVAASFVPVVGGLFAPPPGTTGGSDPVATINAKYQPSVAALTNQLQSQPTSYTALVSLGNTYFDWANEVQQAGRTTPAAAGADQPLWVAAKDAYGRAVEQRDDEPPVLVDYAISQFYSGETDKAIESAEKARKVNPEFAPAYFNLGIFYAALGQNDTALSNFQRTIELDPQGTQLSVQSVDYAKQQVQALQGGTATTTPAP